MRSSIRLAPLGPQPRVTVMMANHNGERFVGEAIESAINQDHDDLEVIVCDDGSTDRSLEVIRRYASRDPRIVLLTKENGGHASALNLAFTRTTGQIVCMLDSDDRFEPGKVAAVVDAYRRSPDAGIAVHDLKVVDDRAGTLLVQQYRREGLLGPSISTLALALPFPQSSGLSFRYEILDAVLPLPAVEFRSAADWAIAYAAAFLTPVVCIPSALAQYRIHDANLSGTTRTKTHLDDSHVEGTLRRMEKLLGFVNEFVGESVVHPDRTRNVLEHRMMLHVLRRDKLETRETAQHLRDAFGSVRADYPRARYLFWQTLQLLPPSLGRALLIAAFKGSRAITLG